MSSGLEQQKLIEVLLLLCPESLGLSWDLAVAFQQQGRELIEQNEHAQAAEKYLISLEKKCSLLDSFQDDTDQWDMRRLDILESCLNLAILQKSLTLSLEVFKTLTLFYKVLQKKAFTESHIHKSKAL
ncbi:MAG: hypothetical protein Q4G59_12375, partial [Planctomycetia bacterium]|nr:hypothetical protein [Planctomycetia bacterium]